MDVTAPSALGVMVPGGYWEVFVHWDTTVAVGRTPMRTPARTRTEERCFMSGSAYGCGKISPDDREGPEMGTGRCGQPQGIVAIAQGPEVDGTFSKGAAHLLAP